jgi:hypothetical protein
MPSLFCSSHHALLRGSHPLVRESHTAACGLRVAARSSFASFLPPHCLFKLLLSGLYYFFFLKKNKISLYFSFPFVLPLLL